MANNTDFASAHRLTKIISVSQICYFRGIDEVIRLFVVKQNVASLLAMTGQCLARTLAYFPLYLEAFVAVFLLILKLLAIFP
ncbi:hypothetical protein ES707_19488 [subsurface metagenome]